MMNPEQIIEALRALPDGERIRVVEQVMQEMGRGTGEAASLSTKVAPGAPGLFADVPDDDWEAFVVEVKRLRETDVLRTADDDHAA